MKNDAMFGSLWKGRAAAFARGFVAAIALLGSAWSVPAAGILQIRDGYLWDPVERRYFVARGFAYQTFNPPVFANQSFPQLEYDLTEFKKMYANSVRAEFVWSQVEVAPDVYDWSKPDYLVAKAEALGLRLFVLIGFQYPPPWFPAEWRGINDRGEVSDVLNYEHPQARRLYGEHITQVVSRYKDSPAIAGWILGNEYAYFDLWESPEQYPARRLLGFDPISQASFRAYLAARYRTNTADLNRAWGAAYASFDEVVMPTRYPADRHFPGYHDLIQWRQKSIGDFVALGAAAARQADPNHLITYSMVGGIFNGNDANNTCEDAVTIVRSCAAAGAPLDFWSINNYAWATEGSELRSGDFGVTKYQELLHLPVMLSETGHSSTEDLLPGAAPRQPKAVPGQLWESLLAGAMGTHLFHWSDRDQFTTNYFLRERGFGIVQQNRIIKRPVYDNVSAMFRQMENANLNELLGGSQGPPEDVQFFWSEHADLVWPRANQENAMIWGALKRLGYQPGIIDDTEFEAHAFTNSAVLLLSRAYQMDSGHLDQLATAVIPAGVHIHANADLPGEFDAYHHRNANWAARMDSLFGLNVANASSAWHSGVTNLDYRSLAFRGVRNLGPITTSYADNLRTWRIWHGLSASSGSTVVTQTGMDGTQAPMPALQIKDLGTAKTAIQTFALGDTFGDNIARMWGVRYDWLRAIYRNHFGVIPKIDISGAGAKHVISDYRTCRNGSILIWVLNEHTVSANIQLRAPDLLAGRVVEDLTHGGILENPSDGTLDLSLGDDDFILLYAYARSAAGRDDSLIAPSPQKIWFESAPLAVWGGGSNAVVKVAYDTGTSALDLIVTLERLSDPPDVLSSQAVRVSGRGSAALNLPIPDADLNGPGAESSKDGADFTWRARLQSNSGAVNQVRLPVRLLWPVQPVSLPSSVQAGQTYPVEFRWQELPSYEGSELGAPLSRADLWESSLATWQNFNITVDLKAGGSPVARDTFVTGEGTGSHVFHIAVPSGVNGPWTWEATLRPAPGSSRDIEESFEGRLLGADNQLPPGSVSLLAPWVTYIYSEKQSVVYLDQGIHPAASHGSQSVFVVVRNPVNPGSYAGIALSYTFPEVWALPADRADWSRYSLSADFRESSRLPGVIELQLKDAQNSWIQVSQPYEPGTNGWQTVRAPLDQFQAPSFAGTFDPTRVRELVINFLMTSNNTVYVASFDNIRFDAPEVLQGEGAIYGLYTSGNDSLPDQDGDGLPDVAETGTGVFLNDTNTGTQRADPDTDDDGQNDGQEVAAGTDPLQPSSVFRIAGAHRTAPGLIELEWLAQPGRSYSVEMSPGPWSPGARFYPIHGLTDLMILSPGLLRVSDPSPLDGEGRLYRVRVHR